MTKCVCVKMPSVKELCVCVSVRVCVTKSCVTMLSLKELCVCDNVLRVCV